MRIFHLFIDNHINQGLKKIEKFRSKPGICAFKILVQVENVPNKLWKTYSELLHLIMCVDDLTIVAIPLSLSIT